MPLPLLNAAAPALPGAIGKFTDRIKAAVSVDLGTHTTYAISKQVAVAVGEQSTHTLQTTASLIRVSAGGFASLMLINALCYVGMAAIFYSGQDRLIFRPVPLPASHTFALADTTEISIPVEGATLSALHFKQPDAEGLIFFLHGTGGNLATLLNSTDFYHKNNFDVFMIDYRGYGKSTGTINNEAQLHADVLTAWKSIAPQYEGRKKVILGRSLGATLAVKLAGEVKPDWTVMVSPFFNIDAVRQDFYIWLPTVLMRFTFTSNEWLPNVAGPITILHGDSDKLIDFTHSARLHALAPQSELIKIHGGTHMNMHRLPQYLNALSERLANL